MTQNHYTHIIVGAGTAGCILASRLSENPDFNILLVEAGGHGRYDPTLRIPIMTGMLLKGHRHVWRYTTRPEVGLVGRQIDLPRGKVMGGSSAINGMVYARGLPQDYDLWAQDGMVDWSWDKVKPYFLRSEQFLGKGNSADHGRGGPMAVSRRNKPVSPLADIFVQAGLEAGYPRSADFNSDKPEGFGYYHFTNRSGYRETTATAFLNPILPRRNLKILTQYEAVRVLIRRGCAHGIELARGREIQNFETDGEIIICCGAIGSPALLMRSGIGPSDHLRENHIDVHMDSVNVGENLQDHVLIRVRHRTNEDVSLYRLTRPDRAALEFLRALFFGEGPMSVFPLEAGAYVRVGDADSPNIQSHFLPALGNDSVRFNPFAKTLKDSGPGFMANASVMRPNSKGRIRLQGKNIADPLNIRLNYLQDARDAEVLVDATEMLRDVFSQKAFDPYRGEELSPGPEIQSRDEIITWVRRTASTVHHLCGTCRMGPRHTDVVDPELKVRGVSRLRVGDASVFPTIPSANTAAPSMMVGEKAAALLSNTSV